MKVAKRATTLAKTGKRLALKTEAAKPEVTRGMLGKVRRAHVKAGIGSLRRAYSKLSLESY